MQKHTSNSESSNARQLKCATKYSTQQQCDQYMHSLPNDNSGSHHNTVETQPSSVLHITTCKHHHQVCNHFTPHGILNHGDARPLGFNQCQKPHRIMPTNRYNSGHWLPTGCDRHHPRQPCVTYSNAENKMYPYNVRRNPESCRTQAHGCLSNCLGM